MSFLNSLMLFGGAAVAIPIIIHFLNRRKFRTITWAAMKFVQAHSILKLALPPASPVRVFRCSASTGEGLGTAKVKTADFAIRAKT